ncbi:MAG TPA: secondary thiamine-phosphate synthase enzyme YjbQ [Candidatus Acidoferrales bacterium]|nr:secondary thiamine-phosphate synthase enzyme YjbQ [Candidatus Acidoferrales bacterium]
MKTVTKRIHLDTSGGVQVIDVTNQVGQLLAESNLNNGLATVFVPGSTATVTTIEYEPGLVADIKQAFDRIAPREARYEHDKRWHDGNGHAHVRAAFLKPSVTIPFSDGALMLGTWQQLVFIELDVRPRNRTVVVQFIGE